MARRLSKNGAGTDKPKTRKSRAVDAPSSDAPMVLGNVTDDEIQEHCLRVLEIRKRHEAAQARKAAEAKECSRINGEYRAELKKVKAKTGLEESDVVFWLNMRDRDPKDVEREVARRNRILVAMNYPVGYQLGLFGDGQTVATKVDNAKLGDGIDDASAAFDAGRDSVLQAIAIDKTDYSEEHPHWLEFLRGRGAGNQELAARPGGLAAGAGEARPN